MKSLIGLVFAAAGVLSAATLNVELTVSHGVESPMGAQGAKSRRVAYFVIDRSGSMAEATLAGGRTPNDALLESLKMRLDALPNGTSVPDRTDWHNVVMFRGLAKIAEKYIHKGDKIYVEGRLRYRTYDDQKGQRRYVTEIQCENLELLTPTSASHHGDNISEDLGGESPVAPF